MQRLFLFVIFLSCSFVTLAGCSDERIDFQDDFEKSKIAWLDFKRSTNDNYRYTATNSTWVGHSWETEIEVRDGKIAKRSFRYTRIGATILPEGGWTEEIARNAFRDLGYTEEDVEHFANGDLLAELQWIEEGKNLGAHGNSMAAVLWTLDEIYAFASESWLKRGREGKSYFEAENAGVISLCGFVPEGCMDDCFEGVRISSIAAL